MLKVYGIQVSIPTNKVRFVLNALNLEYDFSMVNLMTGEQKSEEFLSLNPVGKVPVLDEDGFILFESNAIIKYLAGKHNSSYYPNDLKSRAIIDQWIDFSSIHLSTAFNRIFFNRIIADAVGVEYDERSVNDGLNFLGNYLPILDNQLSKNPYLAGDEMTLADFNLLATLDPAEVSQVDLSPYPNLSKYRDELRQQDFYTKCHNNYGEALQALGG